MNKLAIITTHPIQYNAPFFRILAERGITNVKVFYTWGESVMNNKYDPGFGAIVNWDIPLLNGYEFCFVKNTASDPGSHHFKGIDNPGLNKDIEQWGATAIMVFGWKFKSHLALLRYFKGRTTILFRGDSTLLDETQGFSIKKLIRSLVLRWVYRYIDKALYVGTANRQYYHKYGIHDSRLVFAPHAIDNERFVQAGNAPTRAALGIPPGAIVFVFSGKFISKKNPHLLLEQFLRLNDPGTELLFVGGGNLEESLSARVAMQPASVKSRIHIIPFQNQLSMPGVYKLGNIFVLPSRGPEETWGLAVNEAMAASRAVLVSDKCGCATDLVEQGSNGYIFKSEDGDDLLEKMRLLSKNREHLAKLGKRSKEIIADWSFEKICIAIELAMGCNISIQNRIVSHITEANIILQESRCRVESIILFKVPLLRLLTNNRRLPYSYFFFIWKVYWWYSCWSETQQRRYSRIAL